ncbi:M23 family metallopeptidase [Phenylobacterium sp.]|uniref:M23 family metallopeptidase n=1 Tax=Phenylobacterium sp. TaxID=1871053 RepID=UPI0025FEC0B0|nr:M23 family metallopeptidase [Phenylobacterium sp.]
MARAEPLTRRIARRTLLGALAAGLAAAPTHAAGRDPILRLAGRPRQGGTLIGRTLPGAGIAVDGIAVGQASPRGLFVVGLDRDSPAEVVISVSSAGGRVRERRLAVAPGDFDIQRIDGLPPQQVKPQGEALLARIAAEAERKARGWSSQDETEDFAVGFTRPLRRFRLSGRFGGQRILNGEPMPPHYGVDLAAPAGTPILAPAPGRVCFAETGLHYEGGLTMIDHGQGLITAYLHQSALRVREGDVIARGQVIGAVGQEGRATGPHLCWRMKWRDRRLDPMLLLGVRAPA